MTAQLAGAVHALSWHPTPEETGGAQELEEGLVGHGIASLSSLYTCQEAGEPQELEAAAIRDEAVQVITWTRLQKAVEVSPQCQALLKLLGTGLPEDRSAWPESLLPYFLYRNHLIATADGVIMCGERPLVPPTCAKKSYSTFTQPTTVCPG